MYCIQVRDLEEGNGALWNELSNSRHSTKELAREQLKCIRATDDEESLCTYRITIVDSPEYFSQPTDRLEY